MNDASMGSTGDWESVAQKLDEAGLPPLVQTIFQRQYQQLVDGAELFVRESSIEPADGVEDAETFSDELAEFGKSQLEQAAVLKLNGGLGTSMGLEGPKSLLKVRGDKSFLQIILEQTSLQKVPLVLMNSFSTHEATLEAIEKLTQVTGIGRQDLLTFEQHQVPKLDASTLKPAQWPANPLLQWCPPGHGDIYAALVTTGTLDRLIDQGRRYLFVSNADNLGATLSTRILGHMIRSESSFLMEVADRTLSDRKGGHLATRMIGGKRQWLLRESAQCHPDDREQFENVTLHRYFNTNNLWIDLKKLKSTLSDNGGLLDLPMIANKKTVDPKDPESTKVIQLETAMGAAIASLDGASAVRVPRSRFAPVKTTGDLLAVRSDAYVEAEDHSVRLASRREGKPPTVQLDKTYFQTIDDLKQRIPEAPSLLECRSLTVEGDVRFDAGVVLRGDVAFQAPAGESKQVESGEYGET